MAPLAYRPSYRADPASSSAVSASQSASIDRADTVPSLRGLTRYRRRRGSLSRSLSSLSATVRAYRPVPLSPCAYPARHRATQPVKCATLARADESIAWRVERIIQCANELLAALENDNIARARSQVLAVQGEADMILVQLAHMPQHSPENP